MSNEQACFVLLIILLTTIVVSYFLLFYPKQQMPPGKRIDIRTPDFETYKDDCLHPCIRFSVEGIRGMHWWMVQSPYYNRNNQIENPILYASKDKEIPLNWEPVSIVCDTPSKGYNSDPTLFIENGKIWIFWRECYTDICDKLGATNVTIGVWSDDGSTFSSPKVFLINSDNKFDLQQCPILIRKGQEYLFYTIHYQYEPERKFIELVIWKGSSLTSPDFTIEKKSFIKEVYTCDKYKQALIFGKSIFLPQPLKHDIWHFYLIEYKKNLLMVSVSEWGKNIMLSYSEDYVNFKTIVKPLINSYVSKQYYLYKPTAFVKGECLYLYYTAMNTIDKQKNDLLFSYGKLPTIRNLKIRSLPLK